MKFSLDLEGRTQPVIFSNRHQYRRLHEPSDETLATADFDDGDDEQSPIRGNQVDSSSRNRFEAKPNVELVSDCNSSTNNVDFGNGKSGHRFTSLDDHEGLQQMRLPLCGYEKYPLVSLEESVRPLQSLLDDNIGRYVFIAKENSRKAKEGLTQDESAAIHLYSMECTPENSSLYIHLNRALRAVNRHGLIPWFLYLKLLLTALFKLPPHTTTVWRGIRGDLSSQYETGQTITWWGVSSCTASVSVIDGFVGNSGSRTLFSIDAKNARSIRHHSMFAKEDEILLLPGTYLRVIGKLNPTKDLTIIQMEEETPPFPLLEHPEPPSAILLRDSSYQETDPQLPAQLSESNNEPPNTKLTPPNKKFFTRVNVFVGRIREKHFY